MQIYKNLYYQIKKSKTTYRKRYYKTVKKQFILNYL